MEFDNDYLNKLLEQAAENPRLRQNLDLRTSPDDCSQRMLNALLPETIVSIHRHPHSSESVICLCGRLDEVLYEEVISYVTSSDNANFPLAQDGGDVMRKRRFKEIKRIHLCPADGIYGCQVPKGVWHTVEVLEPSVIYEAKDGKYGEDGSESFEMNSNLGSNL